VVRDGTGDDLVLGGLSLQLPVVLGELERGLDRLAAARGEEDVVEVAGREVRDAVGGLDARGCAYDQSGKNASSSACFAAAWAMRERPWPALTTNRPASPSM
jgi:hypothetical protein